MDIKEFNTLDVIANTTKNEGNLSKYNAQINFISEILTETQKNMKSPPGNTRRA